MSSELVLRVWENDFGSPSVDPDCVELLTLFKINKLSFTIKYGNIPQWTEIPSLKTEKEILTGVEAIQKEIFKNCPTYVDKLLTASEVGRLQAYKKYFKEFFCIPFHFDCWVSDRNYEHGIKQWYSNVIPFPLSKIYLKKNRGIADGHFQDMLGRENSDLFMRNLEQRAVICLEDFARLLDDGRVYFLGNFPTSLDALVYAHLVVALNMPLPSSYLQVQLKTQINLLRFVSHMKQTYFPDTPNNSKYLEPYVTNEDASTRTLIFAGFCVTTFMLLYGSSIGVIKVPYLIRN